MLRQGQHVTSTGLQRYVGVVERTTPTFTTIAVAGVGRKTIATKNLVVVRGIR